MKYFTIKATNTNLIIYSMWCFPHTWIRYVIIWPLILFLYWHSKNKKRINFRIIWSFLCSVSVFSSRLLKNLKLVEINRERVGDCYIWTYHHLKFILSLLYFLNKFCFVMLAIHQEIREEGRVPQITDVFPFKFSTIKFYSNWI